LELACGNRKERGRVRVGVEKQAVEGKDPQVMASSKYTERNRSEEVE
jgi:hypothetical protein